MVLKESRLGREENKLENYKEGNVNDYLINCIYFGSMSSRKVKLTCNWMEQKISLSQHMIYK
jgi:hypothetical protein